MSSFSQKHAPPPRQLGPEIPSAVRRAIATWFADCNIDWGTVQRGLFQKAGYSFVDDVADDVRDRWGEERAELLYYDIRNDPKVARWSHGDAPRDEYTKVIFLHMPEPLYLDYLEEAIAEYVRDRSIIQDPADLEYMDDPRAAPVRFLNDLFARKRIDYRFNNDGEAEWHGDEGAYREAIAPALDALDGEKVAAARDEFTAALGHLRAGTPKNEEDAIDEAAKAVESMMKVALAERGIARTGKETAEPLWNLLRESGVVPRKTKYAILAASQLRNEYAHGAGEATREIPEGIPALTVQAAAAAIVYLATLVLP